LKSAFGIKLTSDERAIFATVAGARSPPARRVSELWCACGRRSGKSRIAAALGVHAACFVPHRLAAGEVGEVAIVAASTAQAKIIRNYCLGFLTSSPVLRREIRSVTSSEIRLRNAIIVIRAGNYRTVRGRTLLCAIIDEVAFLRDETSAQPDIELVRALAPSLATVNGLMIGVSSVYRKSGLLFQKYRDHFGRDGDDVLVVAGASRIFNETLDEGVINRARLADPEAARAEWGAEFRNDLESYVSFDVVQGCIGDHVEMGPLAKHRYTCFVDPAGGSGTDSFTLAIAHKEGERIIVDCLRERPPPFSPQAVIDDLAVLLKTYKITRVTGDRFGGEFPREQFRNHGIDYVCSEKSKSDLFRDLLPLLNSGRMVLPRSDRLVNQLCGLERRVARSGRDLIDHSVGSHDDLANACAGAAVGLATGSTFDSSYDWVYGKDGPPSQPEPISLWRHPIFQGLGGLYHR
jgi:hypothetical protein